jgi:hypothetical protein
MKCFRPNGEISTDLFSLLLNMGASAYERFLHIARVASFFMVQHTKMGKNIK